MKYVLVISDIILDDIKEKYPYIEEKPIVRPLFIDESGNSVYLSKLAVKALNDAAAKEVFEHVKRVHENSVYGILKSGIDSVYYDTDSVKDITKKEE